MFLTCFEPRTPQPWRDALTYRLSYHFLEVGTVPLTLEKLPGATVVVVPLYWTWIFTKVLDEISSVRN